MSGDPYTRRSESCHRMLPSITVVLCRDIGDDSPTWANHKKSCQPVIYRTNQHDVLDDHEKDQVPESGLMIRGIDGDALCIDDGKMSFMDGRLNTKVGV
ncbi:hypothetical protein P692DRAFT_20840880 [Suillus brevipes Sb2]|nr:hypothetical protein P692DRAFT_20840880 [Suillus brevipes Sb2]